MYSETSTSRIILNILLFFLVTPCLSTGRKYDVEQEAEKLYGEDFRSVLLRFRKTPDYLKILSDKMNDMKMYVKEMSLQVLHYYHGKMTQKVGDMVGVTRHYIDETEATPPLVYYHSLNGRRQSDEEINKDAIKKLDDYHAFNYALTVDERNSYRDLGFEFAGNLIHTIIHNMGPDDGLPKSTQLSYGGEDVDKKIPTTPVYPHTHEITQAQSTKVDNGHTDDHVDPMPSESLRYKYNPPSGRR